VTHLIACHNPRQKWITISTAPPQIFFHILTYYAPWPSLSVDVAPTGNTPCDLPGSCTIVCGISMLVLISKDMERMVQCMPLFTPFSTLVTFFRLMKMSACPSHGMSIVHCLPVPMYGANPPPLYFTHMQHYRRHTSVHKFQQTDILLLKENKSLPSGHLDGFSICTPSLTLQLQSWTFKF
jgi:hypothetical protein